MHTPRVKRFALAALLLAASPWASAQIAIPPVQVPNVPAVPSIDLNRTVNDTLGATDRQLREVRRLRVRDLLRTNRAALEADPRGEPMVRSQITAFSPSPQALDRARAAGFSIARTRTLEGLDATVVILTAPAGMSTRRALQRLRDADPGGVYDFNHVYVESGEAAASSAQTDEPSGAASVTGGSGRVGLIDGGVQADHAVFRQTRIHSYGCGEKVVPSAHGTAVASLIAGHAAEFDGAAPGAELYAADVYCGEATGGAIDAIADAFAWMSRERVPVINISLVGPANATLEQVIRIVTARGHVVVAAVGNDGPSAPPLYPAAYPSVVAVTGVDGRKRVLVEACRGKHVDFAAPGADMSAAGIEQPYSLVRGTSFAAPLVAGLLARQLQHVDKRAADAAVAALQSSAADLGSRGPDKIYGNGLIAESLRPSRGLAARR
jgi:subtilisin family serine protease